MHESDPAEHLDVLIVGAGLSGIGAGFHLQDKCPDRSYAILEARTTIGGTWDLFRYPGIRSDSDMLTLGYAFAPWSRPEAIADGGAILEYIKETASRYRVDEKIRFQHRVVGASWSSRDARWTLTVERGDPAETVTITCNFLYMCSGYYDYKAGYTPQFPGIDTFAGEVVHPQAWSDAVEYEGKRIVVIGSGATAVTLVPALAKKAEHVTMLQRTPSYVVSRPARDPVAERLDGLLPRAAVYRFVRWKSVVLGQLFFRLCKRAPGAMKRLIMKGVREELGEGFDVETHFNPPYGPWDQRLCLVPDSDLFEALRGGKASVVTDHIESFTTKGIQLRSGETLEADLVVTATGLNVKLLGGASLTVDDALMKPSEAMGYKSMMFSDVPNFAMCFGYTNASWTLKADLTSAYVCRLLNHMKSNGHRSCVPRRRDPSVKPIPFMNLDAGYVQRSLELFPKGGSKNPWKLKQNYLFDLFTIRMGKIDDGVLEFA